MTLTMTFTKEARLRAWAQRIKVDVHAICLASRDPRVPWHAKLAAALVAVYALSPIDLIPDFIPVLGYLDDLIIVPLGVLLVIKLVPPEVMAEHRAAALAAPTPPASVAGAVLIIAMWIVGAAVLLRALIENMVKPHG